MGVFKAVLLLWLIGTALNIAPTAEAQSRLTSRDPEQMCEGCQARRRAQLKHQGEWYVWGPMGAELMLIASASRWPVAPLLPALYRLTGEESYSPCVGAPCAARKRYVSV